MSKNLTRKGLALSSGLALVATGLVGLPATAAAGDVSLAPSSGTTWNVFSTDAFSMNTTVSGLLPANVEDGTLSYVITNPDQIGLAIDMGAGGADNGTVKLTGYTALGASVAVSAALKVYEDTGGDADFTDNAATDIDGKFLVDFDHHDIVKLVISNIAAGATSKADTWTIEAVDTSAANDQTAALFLNQEDVTNLAYDSDYGTVSIGIQGYLETDSDLTTVENGSTIQTITFYDPAAVSAISTVERFRATGYNAAADNTASALELNDAGDTYLTGTVKFTADINFNQITWSNWKVAVDSSTDADDKTTAAIDLRAANEAWAVNDHNFEVLTPAGYSSSKLNAAGKVYFRTAVTGNDLTEGATYKVSFRHASDTAPFNDFDSPAAEVLATAAAATNVEAAISTPADVAQDDAQDTSITVRPGSKTLTFTAQIRDNANADLETANVPVLAVVTSATYFPTGEAISLTGTTNRITLKDQTIVSTSLTNADGQATFVVTSTTALASQVINVEFYVLQANDTFTSAKANGGAAATYAVTYTTASASTIEADATVLASAKPSVTFSITDSYGEPVSSNSKGAFSVELKAPNKANLELYAPVKADGTVTFTFDNYLTAGQADVLTAKVFTGTSTNPTYPGLSTTVSLYSVAAVAGINVDAKITGVVVDYVDYISGKSTTAAPGPTGGTTYSGTVVDANGSGVPGAQVTISGSNMQFKNGSLFYKDTVTLNATAAGTFSVTFWTHKASATGEKITVTSGGKTATTTVTSKVQDGDGALSAKNLKLSWNVPAQVAMNTTYAVVATVTDVWGNPIKGAEVVFSGYAAAEFNAAATATKTTAADGKATAYLRSIKDVDGLAAIALKLNKVNQDGDANEDVDDLATVFTDVTTTSWNEANWNRELTQEINFSRTAVATSGKVNVGSFNGKLVVYASGLNGARISWKVGGNWGSAVATSNYSIFNRPTPRAGVTVSVDIYVNGVKTLTKSVVTR